MKLFSLASSLTCLIFMIIVIIGMIKLLKQNSRISTLENYNKTLLKVNDNISGFKHDFSNFIQALDGYVETENISGIKNMSACILKECIDTRNLEKLNPNIINNPAVYSIISKKFFLARSKGINMNLEILTDIDISLADSYIICKILAILLDNAIEAAKECNEGFINLKIVNDVKANRKNIIIENTYNNKNIDLEKVFEKGFTSKKSEIQSHGLGLWHVKKILRRKENLNLYTSKGELFSQQLEIYQKNSSLG